MGKSFDSFSSGLGVAGSVFTGLSVANGLIQGFVNGDIDSPGDFFNVLFGGSSDTFQEETKQALADIQRSLDEISVDIRALGVELQTQIDAQTNLLLNVDISSLIGRADTVRTELSGYNPTALPGEIGYVSDADFDGFVRDLRRDSNEVLNQMTQIASAIVTPREGYTPNVNTLATAAAAVEYMAGIRLMIALNFDRDELAAQSLTSGLKQAADFLSVVGPPIRSLVESETVVSVVSATASGTVFEGNPITPRLTDEFNYTYTYYTVDATVGGASQSSVVNGVLNNRYNFFAGEISFDSNGDPFLADPTLANVNFTRTGDSGNGGRRYDVTFTDPSWNVNGVETSFANPSLPAALRPEVITEILDNFGLASGEDVFADLATELNALSNGIEDFRPDANGNIDGSDGRDLLTGDSNDNEINGNGDNDTLRGRDGDDYIIGGSGDDLIRGDAGDDTLVGVNGDDVIFGGTGNDSILGGSGRDMLSGDAGDDLIRTSGLSTIFGGDGNDTLEASVFTQAPGPGGQPGSSDTGDSQLEIDGGAGDDSITGSDRADTILGGSGNDTIRGGGSNDRIIGGAGNDVINGGWGADTAVFSGMRADYHFDVTREQSVLTGPDGQDTLSLISTFEFEDTTVDVLFSNGTLAGGTGDDILIGSGNDVTLSGLGGNDTIFGDSGNDVIEGGEGDDILYAGAGFDTLNGGSGNDLLVSGAGGGRLIGGAGDDTIDSTLGSDTVEFSGNKNAYSITISDDRLFIDGVDGNDLVIRPEAVRFADTFFYMRLGTENSEVLTSPGGTALPDQSVAYSGLGGDDTILAGGGADTLDGGAGADVLDGGAGTDTASYASSDSRVIVRLSDGLSLGGHAAGDTLISIENLTGSNHDDALIGAFGMANKLDGGDGDDLLRGLSGDNTLIGGDGDDTLDGGAGADELDGGDGVDTAIYERSDSRVIVRLFDSLALGGHADGDTLTNIQNLVGSAHDDALIGAFDTANKLDGGDGDDLLRGLSGDNTLIGGDGDDTLDGGAGADELDGGDGIDTASYTGSGARVIVRLWDGTALGGHAMRDTLTSIENLIGSDHDDALIGAFGQGNRLDGGAGDDTLRGLSGNDTLIGGAGADSLDGGAGIDTASYETAGSRVIVRLFDSRTLGGDAVGDTLTSIENLIGSDHNDVLIGAFDEGNLLEGGDGNDILRGLSGADTLIGGAGADQLEGGGRDGETDVFFFSPGAGADTVTDFADNEDRMEFGGGLTGPGDLTLTQQGSDVLIGYGSGDSVLVEGITVAALSDDIAFTAGDGDFAMDSMGRAVGDSVAEPVASLVRDGAVGGPVSGQILQGSAADEILTGGSEADTIMGMGGDDMLSGGAGSDVLFGGDGFDFLNGGFGMDRLNGGAGGDSFFHLGAAGHGFDWIEDYDASEGDVLIYGGGPVRAQDFLVQFANTAGAGAGGVDEAFITHTPSGNVLWALVDGEGLDQINLRIGDADYGLLT